MAKNLWLFWNISKQMGELILKVTAVLKRRHLPDHLCFEVKLNDQAQFLTLLQFCKERHNNYIKVTLQPPSKPRTTGPKSQNNRIHGFAQQIANYTGDDIESIKLICKERALSRGYPVKKDEKDNVIISLVTRKPIPESSSDISTIEAGYLIDELERLAAELEIILEE